MRNKILLSLSIIVISLTIFTACEKEEKFIEKESEAQEEISSNVHDLNFSNGMIVFKSLDEYNAVMENLTQLSNNDFEKREIKIGFISQQRILENALQEEEKYFEQYNPNEMTREEIAKILNSKKEQGYSHFTKEYIEKGILKPYESDDISSLELTVNSWIDARFLNLDGMVKIEDIIYQFTPTQCKELKSGDFGKINILKNTTKDNPEQNIYIGNLKHNAKDVIIRKKWGHSETDKKKIEADIWIKRWDYEYSGVKTYFYYTAYRNYKKNVFGKFKQDPDADTFHYIYADATWNSGSQMGYYSGTDINKWAMNNYIIKLFGIPYNEKVTFTLNYSWFRRDDVPGIELTHTPYTL